MARHAVLLLAALLASTVEADAADRIRITRLDPARTDSSLVCSLTTQGLPDPPSREALASGLPSALTVSFTVIDGRGKEVGRSQVEVRIEPDLWDGIYKVRLPFMDRKAATMDHLAGALRDLGPLPVLPAGALARPGSIRLRARLAVHPVAPAERLKARGLFGARTSAEGDRREVSVGFGSLVRLLLGGGAREGWAADTTSAPFRWTDLRTWP